MFNWDKKGRIFVPNDSCPNWMKSHAQVPITLFLKDRLRIYFSTRGEIDNENQFTSNTGFVDVDINNLHSILRVSDKPILELGDPGSFDEFGIMASSVIEVENEYWIYYTGWERKKSVPYKWSIGVAKSENGENFKRFGKGPLMGSTLNDPFLQACPSVFRLNEREWHMFYLSGTRWFQVDGKLESQYVLKHAISNDGLDWKLLPEPIIEEAVPYESQTSSTIFRYKNIYHMLFSYRYGINFREEKDLGYRIGYAKSTDLMNWERDDENVNLDVSKNGWDSEMLAYPHLFSLNGKINLFYSGNYFGKSGFGLAQLTLNDTTDIEVLV